MVRIGNRVGLIFIILIFSYIFIKFDYGLMRYYCRNISDVRIGYDPLISYFDKFRLLYELENRNLLTPRMKYMICSNSIPKNISGLRKRVFWNKDLFPSIKLLENNYITIKNELINVLNNSKTNDKFVPIGDQNEFKITQHFGNKWSTYNFYWDMQKNKNAFMECPKTSSIIDRINNKFGWACFSRIDPHFDINPHRGYTNMRLTLHMGLINLRNCYIKVNGIKKKWREGEVFIFDDMYEHMVKNNSDKERIILIIDLFHPDLTYREIQAYKYYINNIYVTKSK